MLLGGVISYARGNLNEAYARLDNYIHVAPLHVGARKLLAVIVLSQGSPGQAVDYLRPALRVSSDDSCFLVLLGHALMQDRRFSEAADMLERAAQFSDDPSIRADLASLSAPNLTRVAALQVAARDTDGATGTLNKALFAAPTYVPALKSLIEFKAQLGEVDQALAKFDEVKLEYPDIAIDVRIEGDLLMKAGRLGEAAAVYRAGFDQEPGTDLLLRLYVARRDSGEAERALGLLEEWLETHPDDLAARRVLAADFITAGRYEAAIAHHEGLLDALPDDPFLLNNLAWLYHEVGDARALSHAERAYELAPEQPATLDTLGWILVLEGEGGRGLKLLRAAQARASRDPGIRYHLAVALNSVGRVAEARRELEVVIDTAPASDVATKARALIETLPAE